MAPMSLMSCNLSEDGVIDIAVAGFVPTSSSKIQRALMILHSERAYTLDDESAFFLFSSEESAVSPISMSNIDMDGDGHAEILATRRLDQTPEEGVLPWASNEEVVLIASDDVAWRKLDTQILWELPGSGTSIVGAIQPDSEDSQIILALPDLRIEILTIHAGKVRSTCYIPQDQLRGSCLMNEADAWQLIYASEAAATKTRIYMRSHE
ncbi:hypothetical protein IH601_12660 [Candidatus Bipolaricaulota bacterium]|jgi:hypothetical protein|nr:hypothetical protein [Candidatus Bipolaricaulota bacterium]